MSGRILAELLRVGRLLAFSGYFLVELVKANWEVAWDVLTPRSRLEPGIVAYRLCSRTPLEITLFANLVTLTPGTLTIALTDEPPTMYIHGMYAGDADDFRAELRTMEDRMLRAWRLRHDPAADPANVGPPAPGAPPADRPTGATPEPATDSMEAS